MPNETFNKILIEGSSKDIVSFFEDAKRKADKKGNHSADFSFNSFIPEPSEGNWYSWRNDNWNVKWDASDVEFDKKKLERLRNSPSAKKEFITLQFFTAWSIPFPIFNYFMKNYKSLKFYIYYNYEMEEEVFSYSPLRRERSLSEEEIAKAKNKLSEKGCHGFFSHWRFDSK